MAACLFFVIWQVTEPAIDLDQTDASVLEGLTYTAPDGTAQAVWSRSTGTRLTRTVCLR